MAFAATTEWDVRTTGNDANGGGFNTASSGTDYSQQDAPQVTYTDLVIDGAVNTNITSAANPFTAAHVGNIINVTAGTGFTVQRVQVVSVLAAVATCDKAVGTVGSTGGAGKLGGALLTIPTAFSLATVAGMTVHIKAGTYTTTSAFTFTAAITIIGYNATHNDMGTKPLLTTATDSINLITSASVNGKFILRNLSLSSTASTPGYGCAQTGAYNTSDSVWDQCVFDGFNQAVRNDNTGGSYRYNAPTLLGCEIKNCVNATKYNSVVMRIDGCRISNCSGDAFTDVGAGAASTVYFDNSLVVDNTGRGFYMSRTDGQLWLRGCTIANNGSDGVKVGTSILLYKNCIVYGNGGWGIWASGSASPYGWWNQDNAFGSNVSGDENNTSTLGKITLTADPFSGVGDYSLNNTAGGGASCRAAGFQWSS